MIKHLVFSLILFLMLGCTSQFIKDEHPEELKSNDEFSRSVKIEAPPSNNLLLPVEPTKTSTPPTPVLSPISNKDAKSDATSDKSKKDTKKKKSEGPSKSSAKSKAAAIIKNKKISNDLDKSADGRGSTAQSSTAQNSSVSSSNSSAQSAQANLSQTLVHEPDIEPQVGFVGRRPVKDPFRVGEKVVLNVSYFNVGAGDLAFEVLPFTTVNGSRSYNFTTSIVSNPLFSKFYAVDDKATTMVSYDTLVPSVFELHVKESGQLKEAQALFDSVQKKATYWEKKYTEKHGHENKKLEWEMLDYSQNVFSAAYYMRTFQWDVGVENQFRVADDGSNIIFKAKCIRKERIETDLGPMDTIVLKPSLEVKGVFKPMGDIFFWLTDDDRKFVVKIESKIKIGTLVGEIKSLQRGAANP